MWLNILKKIGLLNYSCDEGSCFLILVETVLLSCVAGAIRSYLQKHKCQDPDDILVCIRTDIRPQHTKLNLDNKFSLAFVKLPVGTEGMILLVIQWPV